MQAPVQLLKGKPHQPTPRKRFGIPETPFQRAVELKVVSDENKILVKGNKLHPSYKCILFAEQEKEMLSENRKLEYYVLGEQFLSSLRLMD